MRLWCHKSCVVFAPQSSCFTPLISQLLKTKLVVSSCFEIRLCTADITFQHPQDDILVVHAGPVEADGVIRFDGEGQWQCNDLTEGSMVPLCGHLWHCSQSWPDILLHLLN